MLIFGKRVVCLGGGSMQSLLLLLQHLLQKKIYCRNKQRVGAKQLQVFHTCSSPAYSLTIVFWSLYVLIHRESVLVGALHAHLRNNSYISRSFLWQNSSRDHWSEWMSTLLWSLSGQNFWSTFNNQGWVPLNTKIQGRVLSYCSLRNRMFWFWWTAEVSH